MFYGEGVPISPRAFRLSVHLLKSTFADSSPILSMLSLLFIVVFLAMLMPNFR